MILLTGCAQEKLLTKIQYIHDDVPAEFLSCQDEPMDPGRGATKGQWMDYNVDMQTAGQDCRDKVNGLRAWNDSRRIVMHR